MRNQSVAGLMCGLLGLALVMPAQAMDDESANRLAAMQQQVDAVNQRLSALESQSQAAALLSLQSQIDTLKSDLASVHGQMDEQTHELALAEKRQTDMYQDLDTRLRALSQGSVSPASAPAADTSNSPSGATGAVDSGTPQAQAYQAALAQFKQGDYKGAISNFNQFLKRYPRDPLAASAQYWIGNAYFSLKDFKNSALAQQKLVKIYPQSPKVTDALLNLSSAQIEMGDLDSAHTTLQTLIKKYPDSPAAAMGKKRLQLLQNASH
jgi:tol-pal system protein YbgF